MPGNDCSAPCVSLDFPQVQYCLFWSAVACNCKTIHLLLLWRVWMWQVIWSLYIQYLFSTKGWMFISSEVWACECQKKSQKAKIYNCTAMCVSSCVRGVDCVIKVCAVNQWLYVKPCWINGWNNTKGKNLFNFNSCLRLSVLDVACFVNGLSVYFPSRLCLKERICIDLSVCWLYRDMLVKLSCFSLSVKTKNLMLWFCGCTQDVLRYYANCAVKNRLFPLSLKNKYNEEILFHTFVWVWVCSLFC